MNDGSSGSEHEEEPVYAENDRSEHNRWLVEAVVAATSRMRNRRRRAPQPMHNSWLTGSMRVEEILNGHEGIISGLISMKAATFRALSHLLGSRGLLAPRHNERARFKSVPAFRRDNFPLVLYSVAGNLFAKG
ncbi:hypothetical protein TIFTF001_056499 [Ficus carica]|uniref:Uncharacterized protein n=1 Tax=Ficus carica TaxID=3494 RepID=A0AA88EI66_FICCA|nr:hypothetical protein TIFTF001_056499 [Ficus carica]